MSWLPILCAGRSSERRKRKKEGGPFQPLGKARISPGNTNLISTSVTRKYSHVKKEVKLSSGVICGTHV